MDYRYWSRFLEPDEFRKWEVETLMRFDLEKFCTNYRHFEDFIRESFDPNDTRDGYRYWSDIIWRVERQLERQLVADRDANYGRYNTFSGYMHPFTGRMPY